MSAVSPAAAAASQHAAVEAALVLLERMGKDHESWPQVRVRGSEGEIRETRRSLDRQARFRRLTKAAPPGQPAGNRPDSGLKPA
jgi:hypothetical protein